MALKVTVVQPPYFAGETPDEYIGDYLMKKMELVEEGGLIVAPNGLILTDLGAGIGATTVERDPKEKYMRTAGFGGNTVRNDQFIADGLRPQVFYS